MWQSGKLDRVREATMSNGSPLSFATGTTQKPTMHEQQAVEPTRVENPIATSLLGTPGKLQHLAWPVSSDSPLESRGIGYWIIASSCSRTQRQGSSHGTVSFLHDVPVAMALLDRQALRYRFSTTTFASNVVAAQTTPICACECSLSATTQFSPHDPTCAQE
jgi:hypothetical protein